MKTTRHLEIFGLTDKGCIRSGNEDCFLVQVRGESPNELNISESRSVTKEEDILIAVADGMGGAAAGEVASSTALEALRAFLGDHQQELATEDAERRVNIVEAGIQRANDAIAEESQARRTHKGMGATITAGYLAGDVLYNFQIGDSRAYVFRDNALYRVTRDQSFVGHLVEMGTITEEQALRHPQRNVILQALGTREQLKVDVSYLPLCRDDLVLVCSDGLYGEFEPRRLNRLMQDLSERPLEEIVRQLIEEAKTAGGKDNITVIGMRIADGFPPREPGENPRYIAFPYLARDNPLERSSMLFR
jgi:protein phosphatase